MRQLGVECGRFLVVAMAVEKLEIHQSVVASQALGNDVVQLQEVRIVQIPS